MSSPKWCRSVQVLERRTLSGVLLLGPGGDDPILLDESGTLVWDLIADASTVEEIAAQAAQLTGADVLTVSDGVASFLEELSSRGIVEATP